MSFVATFYITICSNRPFDTPAKITCLTHQTRHGTNLKIPNLKLPEPWDNRTLNLPNQDLSTQTKLWIFEPPKNYRTLNRTKGFYYIEMSNFLFVIGTHLNFPNFKPSKSRFVLQNQTSNLPNHPKKTKPLTSNLELGSFQVYKRHLYYHWQYILNFSQFHPW